MIINILQNYGSFIAKLLIPLVSIPVVARASSEEYLDQFMLFMGLVTLFSLIFEFAFNQVAVPRLIKGDGKLSYFEDGRKTLLIFSLIITGTAYLLGFTILAKGIFAGSLLGLLPIYVYHYKSLYKELMIVDILCTLLFFIGFALVYAYSKYWYIELFIIYRVVNYIGQYLYLLLLKELTTLDLKILSIKDGLHCLRHNFGMCLSRIVTAANTSINVPMVGLVLGTAYVSEYAIPEKIVFSLISLVYPLNQVLTAFFSKHSNNRVDSKLIGMALFFISSLIAFIMYAFGSYVIMAFVGQLTDSSKEVFQILVWLIPARVVNNYVFAVYFFPNLYFKKYIMFTVVYGAIGLSISPVVTWKFGVGGLAVWLISLECILFLAVTFWLFLVKRTNAQIKD